MSDLQELQDLENLEVEKVEEPAPKPLQKPKIKKGEKPVTEDAVKEETPIVKTRKPKTEKQLAVFNKAREKMLENLKVRKEKQAEDAVIRKREIEEAVVKKAIAIKKKQIKEKAILEQISDDETPIEEVKKIAKKIAVKKAPPVEPEKELTIFEKYKFI